MNPNNTEKDKARKFVERYAGISGFKLNPAREIAEEVVEGLARNMSRHGKYYCPCRIITGSPEKDRVNICPCKWHKEEIKEFGHCHCNLYYKG